MNKLKKQFVLTFVVLGVMVLSGCGQKNKIENNVKSEENSGHKNEAIKSGEQEEPTEAKTNLKVYENSEFGLKFQYPEELSLEVDPATTNDFLSVGLSDGNNYVFQVSTQRKDAGDNDFYKIPSNMNVKEWVIGKQGHKPEDFGAEGHSNKIMTNAKIAGQEALHLESRTMQGGSYDDFYFARNGQLYFLQITNDPNFSESLSLEDNEKWYTKVLNGFEFIN